MGFITHLQQKGALQEAYRAFFKIGILLIATSIGGLLLTTIPTLMNYDADTYERFYKLQAELNISLKEPPTLESCNCTIPESVECKIIAKRFQTLSNLLGGLSWFIYRLFGFHYYCCFLDFYPGLDTTILASSP